MVELPLEPIYEETIVGASAQSERERNARNAQQKMNWQNKCQRLIEVGIMCGDKPWSLADRKTVSLLYLSIGIEGRRILNCKNPHIMIDTLATIDFWKIVEEAFIRPRNITFDRHVFLIIKKLRGETVEHFHGKLKELAENCDFENKEETLIRDVFITNLIDSEIQKELLKQSVEPRQALELAINMELGMRYQHQIQQHNKIVVPANVNAVQFNNNSRRPYWQNNNNVPKQNNRSTLYCSNCGGVWLPNHREKCIAKGKTCNNCALLNHFAKVCRKQQKNINVKPQDPKKKMVRLVEEEPHPEDSVNFVQPAKLYESDYSSGEEDNTVAMIETAVEKVEPLNLPLKIGNVNTTLLVDSGSACSILHHSLAPQVVQSSPRAFWIHESSPPQLRNFSNEPIQVLGKIQAPVTSKGWVCDSATFTVQADGLKSLIGRDLLDQLGLAATQCTLLKGKSVNNIASLEFKEQIAKKFPGLVSRNGRSKSHVAKSKFHKNFQPRHQKGRRIPINLQDKFNTELRKLLAEKHIIKLSSCPNNYFISPIVVTFKKDQTIKLALDSKVLNKAIHKNKYQMPNIDTLIESISQQISAPASQNITYFSTIDLKYAYSQLNLDINTANHCNFNIISGDMTGTYRFQTGFYGLTDMPAEIQKAMDYTLIGLENTYCFLDDILIVSKGSLNDHKSYVMKCLQRLDDENFRINLPKCHFGKLETDWLGYHISQEGISPLESKTAAILALEAPKTLKKRRSFLGSVHYIGKFIPNLAQISHPLRPLLRKSSKFIWTTEHENCFQEIKTRIANATANSHYKPQLETRVKCDASRSGLGAALEQLTVDGWKPIAFTSRFLNSCEERYSVNELELLGVVWSIEYFKNYLYGKQFKVITDHRALLSIMKEHRSNKSYNSRLTRWVDRLLPYQFDIEHLPGAKMGLVDYISRNPSQKAKKISTYDEEFIVAKLKLISKSVNALELNTEHPASHLQQLLTNYTLDPQNKSQIETIDPALQTTPKIETINNSINSISTRATRVREHVFGNSLAPRNHASTSICQLNNLKYVTLASQSPLCTSLALQNTSNNKQLIQIRNKKTYAQRERQITQ